MFVALVQTHQHVARGVHEPTHGVFLKQAALTQGEVAVLVGLLGLPGEVFAGLVLGGGQGGQRFELGPVLDGAERAFVPQFTADGKMVKEVKRG